MALKLIVGSLDEVEENFRPLYKERADKRFQLDAEGELPDELAAPLQNALRTERTRADAAEKARLAELAKFKDVDPDRYRELLTEHEKLAAKTMIDQGKAEELIESRTKERTARLIAEHESVVGSLRGENQKLSAKLQDILIDGVINTEALREDAPFKVVSAGALDDLRARLRRQFQVDAQGNVVAKGPDGEVLYGKDPTKPLTIAEALIDLSVSPRTSHLFKTSSGSGAGPSANGGPHVVAKPRNKMTDAEKAGYIKKFGQDKYFALPAN